MEFVFVLLMSFAPAVVWVWYFKRHDSRDPEPNRMLVSAFTLGMLTVVPTARVEAPFLPLLEQWQSPVLQLIGLVVVVGLVEELAKLAVVYLVVARSREFDEVIDGIIYMVTTALGFAAAENLFYMLSYGWEIGPARAVISSLAHAAFSGLIGFQLGKLQAGIARGFTLVVSLLGVSFFHGLYNFVLLNPSISSLFSLVLIAVLVGYLFYQIAQAKKLH